MSEHLTEGDLERYGQRSAPASMLLLWDDHLAGCEECRERIVPKAALARWAAGLANAAEDTEQNHLSYEQLAARAEGRVADSERFAVESHLQRCPACSEELADLVRFRASMKRSWLWPIAVAAAVVAALVAVSTMRRTPALNIPAAWPAADRALVAQAIGDGKLPLASAPPDVLSKRGKLLGTPAPDSFIPLRPVGAVMERDRPEFQWQGLAGPASYKVEVYDSGFHLVTRSAAQPGTTWTPPQPLERGQLYHWQVVATRGGDRITAPAPPAPDAEFRILDAATEERIARARTDDRLGHLLAAVLLAEAGMKTEAADELDMLPAETRRLPQIEKLAESLR